MKGLIFTYVMTYGGALVAVIDPFVGLLIYICFAIVKPDILWAFSVPEGNYSRIIAIALMIGWLAKNFGSWQFGRAAGVVYAYIGFWIWAVISTLLCANQSYGMTFVEATAKVLLPFLIGITLIDSIAKLKALAWVMLISQGYIAYELNLSYYQGFNQVHEYGFVGMDNNCVAVAMNSAIGLAFFLGLYAKAWWQKAIALIAAMLMAHTVLFAFSRGGMLGLVATGVACFFLIPKKPIHYALFLVVVLIVFRLAGTEVKERFLSSFGGQQQVDASAESRVKLWQDCLDVAIKNPFFGVGPNHWPLIAHTYGWPPGKEGHTLWLQVAAELGFGGLLWLGLFYGRCIVRLAGFLRSGLDVADPWPRAIASMVIASLAGFIVAAQFVSLVGLELPFYITLMGAGLLKVTSLAPVAPPILAGHPLPPGFIAFGAGRRPVAH
jgi:putative inorganic carbon (hco3(-)) transporter